MFKGFRSFLLRGNVFELAVAVVIGTAFTAVVTAVVNNLIQPLIAAIGGHRTTGLTIELVKGNVASTVNFAAVITAVVNFILIGAVVYFAFVLPVQKIMARRDRAKTAEPVKPTDVELLTEIRDLLREQRHG